MGILFMIVYKPQLHIFSKDFFFWNVITLQDVQNAGVVEEIDDFHVSVIYTILLKEINFLSKTLNNVLTI